jgi:hypothetical protein
MSSEARIPAEPRNVFIYSKETKDKIPKTVTHVKVDPSVKEIHDGAFKDCHSLVEVEFSEGLEVIGRSAFHECRNLKHIQKLPSTLKEIGVEAFWGCESFDSIEFPEGLQVIGEAAFGKCGELKRIKIPSAHVVIGERAFSECYGLVSVELPEGLQVIGKGWFDGCRSLTTVNVPSSVIEIAEKALYKCTSLASLDFPEGLQSIGLQSFSGCKSLTSLHIPSTVCKISMFAFDSCVGLRSIALPEALETIEDHMFYMCTSLTHIAIPPTVTKIGCHAFAACISLKTLRIPSSVVRIGERAFVGCEQLTSIHLLGNLQTIERETFHDCISLTHVRIPWSVTRIGSAAFLGCTRLTSLELPEGLETLYFSNRRLRSITGCESSVNLVILSEQHVKQMRYSKVSVIGLNFRRVASNVADLVSELQHRFDDLPMHRVCYYQSYYPLTEAMDNLKQAMYADARHGTKVDAFGMTPCHILSLSQTPNLSLLQILLKIYRVDILHEKDNFRSTPIDYLCLNPSPEVTAVFQSLLPMIFAERLRQLGSARWTSDMLTAMDEAATTEWSSRKKEMRLLYFKFATYERLESMSLLELALWKVKMDGCKPANDDTGNEESGPKRPRLDISHLDGVDRLSCRISSGANVVISNVLPFLDKICREDYYVGDESDTNRNPTPPVYRQQLHSHIWSQYSLFRDFDYVGTNRNPTPPVYRPPQIPVPLLSWDSFFRVQSP